MFSFASAREEARYYGREVLDEDDKGEIVRELLEELDGYGITIGDRVTLHCDGTLELPSADQDAYEAHLLKSSHARYLHRRGRFVAAGSTCATWSWSARAASRRRRSTRSTATPRRGCA